MGRLQVRENLGWLWPTLFFETFHVMQSLNIKIHVDRRQNQFPAPSEEQGKRGAGLDPGGDSAHEVLGAELGSRSHSARKQLRP